MPPHLSLIGSERAIALRSAKRRRRAAIDRVTLLAFAAAALVALGILIGRAMS